MVKGQILVDLVELVMYKKLFMASLLFIVLLLVMLRMSNQKNIVPELEQNLDVVPTEIEVFDQVSPTIFEQEAEVSDSDYEIYTSENMGFSVEHPKSVPVSFYEDGSVGFVVEGPTQKAETEFFDGIAVVFQKMPLEGKKLATVVEENRAINIDIQGADTQVSPIKKVSMGGIEGLSFSEQIGEYIFLPISTDSYLSIANLTSDPGELGYKEIAKKIIDSLKIL